MKEEIDWYPHWTIHTEYDDQYGHDEKFRAWCNDLDISAWGRTEDQAIIRCTERIQERLNNLLYRVVDDDHDS